MNHRPDPAPFAWTPSAAVRQRARLTEFLNLHGSASFAELQRRSTEDVVQFTEAVLQFTGVRFHRPYRELLDLSRGLPWARWCVDGGLNISESCLDRHVQAGSAAAPAVIWEGEEGAQRTLRYGELAVEVERCAAGLRAAGTRPGAAVGIFLPMLPETVVSLLALARIGAIAVPLFSGFGPAAIATRLQDVGAELLITCDAFPRRGRLVEAKTVADEAASRCSALKRIVVVSRAGASVAMRPGRDQTWDELLAAGDGAGRAAGTAEPTGAEDPLIVLFTSGTTGRPKGIAHTHCSFPVKGAQDMAFGTDVGSGDRILWVTDLGWMMGPWLIYGSTLLGATMVLYDGAIDHPRGSRLWEVCARHRVGILGVAPTLVRTLAGRADAEPSAHDLSALRILASTGEPWNPGPWWWLFNEVGKGQLPIINYSGGTEISGGILMGNPLLPVRPCAFAAPCPGIAADVVDESGRPVRGAVGELVIRKPWIGMARGFWKDDARYLETYWSRWPDVWVHGDWARLDEDGQWYILGRSDDTFKVAGKRVGPAEVESALVGHPQVLEAAVVGVPHPVKGTALVAVCVPAPRAPAPGPALNAELLERVGDELGKPLRPEAVLFVPSLPKTRNGKVMRRVVRAACLDEDPGDITSLENPDSVDIIRAQAASLRRRGAREASPEQPPQPATREEPTRERE